MFNLDDLTLGQLKEINKIAVHHFTNGFYESH